MASESGGDRQLKQRVSGLALLLGVLAFLIGWHVLGVLALVVAAIDYGMGLTQADP